MKKIFYLCLAALTTMTVFTSCLKSDGVLSEELTPYAILRSVTIGDIVTNATLDFGDIVTNRILNFGVMVTSIIGTKRITCDNSPERTQKDNYNEH